MPLKMPPNQTNAFIVKAKFHCLNVMANRLLTYMMVAHRADAEVDALRGKSITSAISPSLLGWP